MRTPRKYRWNFAENDDDDDDDDDDDVLVL